MFSGSLALTGVLLVLMVLLLNVYLSLFGPDNTASQRRAVAVAINLVLGLIVASALFTLLSLAHLRGTEHDAIILWGFVVLVAAIPIVGGISAIITMRS